MKRMAAGSFKIHCLAVMDEAQAKRETVLITKHGKPVAKLIPADKTRTTSTISWLARVPSLAISSLQPFQTKTGVNSSDSCGHAGCRVAGI